MQDGPRHNTFLMCIPKTYDNFFSSETSNFVNTTLN